MKKIAFFLFLSLAASAHADGYNRELCRGTLADGRTLTLDSFARENNVVWMAVYDARGNKEDTAGDYVNADDTSPHETAQILIVESDKANLRQRPVHDSCYVGTEGSFEKTVLVKMIRDEASRRMAIPQGLSLRMRCEFYDVVGKGDCRE